MKISMKSFKWSVIDELTLQSQLPAIKKFCGIVAGEKAKELTLSSGGEVTSKSFIGFADDGVVVEPNADVKPLWLNIFNCNKTSQSITQLINTHLT